MEAKLKQLDAERDELAKYQAIDRECRSLEYAIHDKEVSDARTKLDEVHHFLLKGTFILRPERGLKLCRDHHCNQAHLHAMRAMRASHSCALLLFCYLSIGQSEDDASCFSLPNLTNKAVFCAIQAIFAYKVCKFTRNIIFLQNEQQRREEAERAGKALDEREAAHVALKKTERELKQVATEQTREQAHLNDVSSSRADAQSKKAQLDLDVMELDERRKEDNAAEVEPGSTVCSRHLYRLYGKPL